MDSTVMAALLPKAKKALRIAEDNTEFDAEIRDILAAACSDLEQTAGIDMSGCYLDGECDALILRAVLTYARLQFGEPSDYDRLRTSYHNQKAQLQSCSGYGLEA